MSALESSVALTRMEELRLLFNSAAVVCAFYLNQMNSSSACQHSLHNLPWQYVDAK